MPAWRAASSGERLLFVACSSIAAIVVFSDSAHRRIDDPAKRHGVARIIEQLQVRQDIFDLAALIKLDAAHQLIGDAAVTERVLDGTRQRVHAI